MLASTGAAQSCTRSATYFDGGFAGELVDILGISPLGARFPGVPALLLPNSSAVVKDKSSDSKFKNALSSACKCSDVVNI